MDALHPFEYQQPTPSDIKAIQQVRAALKVAYDALHEYVPASRERSLALTKMEEASMWANKGIVFNS
jgi:hypothetical protein